MIGTFAYLILTSARNRVRARIARLRNPRYAVAMVIGVVYIWMVYLRPSSHQPSADDMLGSGASALLPLLTLAFVAWVWLFGADRSALAFTEAEVTLLFAAPVSRRTLVLYKLARTQLTILTTSIVWTLIFRQGSTIALALTHMIGYWVLLSTLNLNRLGVALVRANGDSHGLRAARRNWIAISIFTVIVGMVVIPLAAAVPRIRSAGDLSAMGAAASSVLATSPARWGLFPFQLLTAPLHSAPGVAWMEAIVPAVLLLAAAALWVLRTDAAFEEAAAEATMRQAQKLEALRQRRTATSASVTHPGRTIPLAPTGAPAVALLWKNAMWILRTGQLRGLYAPPLVGLLCVLAFSTRSPSAAMVIGIACLLLATVMLLIGPISMRNDLRSELLHLSLLKTFPLRGREVVLAEVGSGALPLALMQYLLGLVGLLSLGFVRELQLPYDVRIALVIGSPLLLVGLNGAVFMIHNAIALLFPGWIRLGAGTAGGGIETLGLGMITLALALVMLGLLVLVPGLAATVVVALLRSQLGVGLALGGTLAAALLLGETMLCAWALGGTLERVEPIMVDG